MIVGAFLVLSLIGDHKVTQGTLQSSSTSTVYPNRCSDEVMHPEQGFGGNKKTSLADEVVSDCSPKTSGEMDDATLSKKPSEQREIEIALLNSEALAADRKPGLCLHKVYYCGLSCSKGG